ARQVADARVGEVAEVARRHLLQPRDDHVPVVVLDAGPDQVAIRSEEHTSELQSLTNLVCRLLLEKKKKKTAYAPHHASGILALNILTEIASHPSLCRKHAARTEVVPPRKTDAPAT